MGRGLKSFVIVFIILKRVNLIITKFLGPIKTNHVLSETVFSLLGAMTWLCCIENRIVVRHVIMTLNCKSGPGTHREGLALTCQPLTILGN